MYDLFVVKMSSWLLFGYSVGGIYLGYLNTSTIIIFVVSHYNNVILLSNYVILGTMSSRSSRTLYVGNLPGDIRKREVEDLFYKDGNVVHIDLKIPPRPPGYAFVEVSKPSSRTLPLGNVREFNLSRMERRLQLLCPMMVA